MFSGDFLVFMVDECADVGRIYRLDEFAARWHGLTPCQQAARPISTLDYNNFVPAPSTTIARKATRRGGQVDVGLRRAGCRTGLRV